MERQPLPPASAQSTKTIAELLARDEPYFPLGAPVQLPGGLVGLAGALGKTESM
jgi:hypothetical protein